MSAAAEDKALWDSVRIAESDNVAVALRDLEKAARIRCGDRITTLPLADPIPIGHKFALAHIAAGADVVKYGAAIGTATEAIPAGRHVHVHNILSRRAGRRFGPAGPGSPAGATDDR